LAFFDISEVLAAASSSAVPEELQDQAWRTKARFESVLANRRLEELVGLRNELATLKASTSWKITAPLRKVLNKLRSRDNGIK
jgi:hypothetical protein